MSGPLDDSWLNDELNDSVFLQTENNYYNRPHFFKLGQYRGSESSGHTALKRSIHTDVFLDHITSWFMQEPESISPICGFQPSG